VTAASRKWRRSFTWSIISCRIKKDLFKPQITCFFVVFHCCVFVLLLSYVHWPIRIQKLKLIRWACYTPTCCCQPDRARGSVVWFSCANFVLLHNRNYGYSLFIPKIFSLFSSILREMCWNGLTPRGLPEHGGCGAGHSGCGVVSILNLIWHNCKLCQIHLTKSSHFCQNTI